MPQPFFPIIQNNFTVVMLGEEIAHVRQVSPLPSPQQRTFDVSRMTEKGPVTERFARIEHNPKDINITAIWDPDAHLPIQTQLQTEVSDAQQSMPTAKGEGQVVILDDKGAPKATFGLIDVFLKEWSFPEASAESAAPMTITFTYSYDRFELS